MSETEITQSSGNVFADLGLADADDLLHKADLAIAITRILDERGLPQATAAKLLGTSQPRVSNLYRGRLEAFTVDHLIRFLAKLGHGVEMRVVPFELTFAASR